MSKNKNWLAQVEGRDEFPIDMLRYDQCWPERELDSGLIQRHGENRIILVRGDRTIGPTVDRWKSYGWKVLTINGTPLLPVKTEPVTKKKIVKVIFERAEGPVKECERKEFTSLAEAQVQATRWSRTAPAPGKGYDKCDFELVFEDGNTYKGRYDLQNTGYNSDGERIFEQVVSHLSYVAGKRQPAGMSDNTWQFECVDHLRTGQAQAAREFLEAYEI